MEWLVWVGAALTVAGLALLVMSILRVRRARRTAKDDTDLRAQIQKALPLNMGGFALSALGLMAVVFGVLIG